MKSTLDSAAASATDLAAHAQTLGSGLSVFDVTASPGFGM